MTPARAAAMSAQNAKNWNQFKNHIIIDIVRQILREHRHRKTKTKTKCCRIKMIRQLNIVHRRTEKSSRSFSIHNFNVFANNFLVLLFSFLFAQIVFQLPCQSECTLILIFHLAGEFAMRTNNDQNHTHLECHFHWFFVLIFSFSIFRFHTIGQLLLNSRLRSDCA